jgi:hypothetical protein
MKLWSNLFTLVALMTVAAVFVAHRGRQSHVTVAYERVHVGMTWDEVEAELGPPSPSCLQHGGFHSWYAGWAKPGGFIWIELVEGEEAMVVKHKSMEESDRGTRAWLGF